MSNTSADSENAQEAAAIQTEIDRLQTQRAALLTTHPDIHQEAAMQEAEGHLAEAQQQIAPIITPAAVPGTQTANLDGATEHVDAAREALADLSPAPRERANLHELRDIQHDAGGFYTVVEDDAITADSDIVPVVYADPAPRNFTGITVRSVEAGRATLTLHTSNGVMPDALLRVALVVV